MSSRTFSRLCTSGRLWALVAFSVAVGPVLADSAPKLATAKRGQIGVVSLLDTVRAGLGQDPQWRIAQLDHAIAGHDTRRVVAGTLPQIGLSYTDISSDTSASGTSNSGSDDRDSTSLTVSQSLVNFELWSQIQAARAAEKGSQNRLDSQQQGAIRRAAMAYFGLLRALTVLNAALAEQKAIDRRYRQIERQYQVGLSSLLEKEEAKFAKDSAESRAIAASVGIDIALAAYSEVTGDFPRRVIDVLSAPKGGLVDTDVESWVTIALSSNPTVLQSSEAVHAAELSHRAAKMAHLPSLGIQFSHIDGSQSGRVVPGTGAVPGYSFDEDRVTLQLSIPLWNGGARYASTARKSAESLRAKASLVYTERLVERNVRQAVSAYQTQAALLGALAARVQSATTSTEATRIGYDVGTRNVVDLLDAERALVAAERDRQLGYYDYIMSVIDVHFAAGYLSVELIEEVDGLLG